MQLRILVNLKIFFCRLRKIIFMRHKMIYAMKSVNRILGFFLALPHPRTKNIFKFFLALPHPRIHNCEKEP